MAHANLCVFKWTFAPLQYLRIPSVPMPTMSMLCAIECNELADDAASCRGRQKHHVHPGALDICWFRDLVCRLSDRYLRLQVPAVLMGGRHRSRAGSWATFLYIWHLQKGPRGSIGMSDDSYRAPAACMHATCLGP